MAAFKSRYGVARTFRVPQIKRSAVDFAVAADWTPAAGDVRVVIDGTVNNITTLPTALAVGNAALWVFSLTAAELTGKEIVVLISDAPTEVIEDNALYIETYGHPSAMHATDPGSGSTTSGFGVAAGSTTTSSNTTGMGLVAQHKGMTVAAIAGTGAPWSRVIDGVTSQAIAHKAIPTAVGNDTVLFVYPTPVASDDPANMTKADVRGVNGETVNPDVAGRFPSTLAAGTVIRALNENGDPLATFAQADTINGYLGAEIPEILSAIAALPSVSTFLAGLKADEEFQVVLSAMDGDYTATYPAGAGAGTLIMKKRGTATVLRTWAITYNANLQPTARVVTDPTP
jgi:hypothetical protein